MARYEGGASVRRVLARPDGSVQIDIKPTGLDWQWADIPVEQGRAALACALTAVSARLQLYVRLPDDAASSVLELIGLTSEPDRG